MIEVLDLFSGDGGAAMGIHLALKKAGLPHHITGVDIHNQKNYPFSFRLANAMHYSLDGFDFIWASPPCQAFTSMRFLGKNAGIGAPDLVDPIRKRLKTAGAEWVIENVPGAPLGQSIRLCGSSFGLGVRRHRMFEASFLLFQVPCRHDETSPIPVFGDGRFSRQEKRKRAIAVYGDHPQQPGDKSYRCNRARTLAEGQQAMGIDWMDWKPLTQAVPPAYSEFIMRQAIPLLIEKAA
jgi:DNA (cytosine-5)-methyltransferase 1